MLQLSIEHVASLFLKLVNVLNEQGGEIIERVIILTGEDRAYAR